MHLNRHHPHQRNSLTSSSEPQPLIHLIIIIASTIHDPEFIRSRVHDYPVLCVSFTPPGRPRTEIVRGCRDTDSKPAESADRNQNE